MRVLAVDHGSKRIGLALSDPSATIANPLMVILHRKRALDAAAVLEQATTHQVGVIVVGQSLADDGQPTFEGRQARRFAEVLQQITEIPVVLWDEAFSTQKARSARIQMGVKRRKRSGHMDELAATVILQSYLDSQVR